MYKLPKNTQFFPLLLWVSDQINNTIDISPHELDAYYGINDHNSVDERHDNEEPIC